MDLQGKINQKSIFFAGQILIGQLAMDVVRGNFDINESFQMVIFIGTRMANIGIECNFACTFFSRFDNNTHMANNKMLE